MHSIIHPHDYVVLRLPSDALKVIQLVPDMNVSLGKFGSFPANQVIGRPFHLTFEIMDQQEEDGHLLRIVPATELHAEALIAEGSEEVDGEVDDLDSNRDDEVSIRTNRDTVDDSSSQKLTLAEIEELKKQATGAGKEIIARLLESHSALGQKTTFSLAKYKLRKQKKFLRRFTVLPMDVSLLTQWMLEDKNAPKIMELRDELIGLIGCWANVHYGGSLETEGAIVKKMSGRYLIVDDTGGLVVAAMAERMGILFPEEGSQEEDREQLLSYRPLQSASPVNENEVEDSNHTLEHAQGSKASHRRRRRARPLPMSASENTLTVIHAHSQPNLSLLKYFSFDQDRPSEYHPLYAHLKTLSWLQLIDPDADPIYASEPSTVPESIIYSWKSSKRSMHYRKLNRWTRVRQVVDETRAGGFDGLIVASLMEPATILKEVVPLMAGSAPVVVYSPTIEPLVELADLYSTARRTAYINMKRELAERREKAQDHQTAHQDDSDDQDDMTDSTSDFPVDPTLLLGPTLQTSRVRAWQVLPGRTHPLMSGRGGAEGYIFHAIRVLPSQDRITARGNISGRKRRKLIAAKATEVGIGSGTGTSTPAG